MAKHEFGIFETELEPGKRYDEYSPKNMTALQYMTITLNPCLGN